jgi:hypothetical protein
MLTIFGYAMAACLVVNGLIKVAYGSDGGYHRAESALLNVTLPAGPPAAVPFIPWHKTPV